MGFEPGSDCVRGGSAYHLTYWADALEGERCMTPYEAGRRGGGDSRSKGAKLRVARSQRFLDEMS